MAQDTDGKYLMVVDEGERHVLSVWEWKRQRLITKTTVGKYKEIKSLKYITIVLQFKILVRVFNQFPNVA